MSTVLEEIIVPPQVKLVVNSLFMKIAAIQGQSPLFTTPPLIIRGATIGPCFPQLSANTFPSFDHGNVLEEDCGVQDGVLLVAVNLLLVVVVVFLVVEVVRLSGARDCGR